MYIQYDSKLCSTETGVPQGFILEHLLFLIYINDLPKSMPSASFFLYADDTTIIVTRNPINTFITNFTSVLDGLSHWFACNKLAVNYKKTNCMFFGRKTLALKHNLAFNFQLDSHVLSIVDTVKFLGIYLDSNLNWHTHTTYIADKISKNTGLIRFASKYLPIDVLIKMYYAYIYIYIHILCMLFLFGVRHQHVMCSL
jgi:hypothetical protein